MRRRLWPGVLVVVLLLSLVLLVTVEAAKVERQTEDQKRSYETLKSQAKQASEDATPALLAYLDSTEFRDTITNLPEELQSRSSEQLLVLLNDTLALSSVTHGLFAAPNSTFAADLLDITLRELISYNLSFVPNLWQRISIGELNTTDPIEQIVILIENTSEVEVFLLPNFTSPIPSLPMSEAQNRVSYGALNLFQDSAGCQLYGNVQLVLRPSYVKDMLILAPYDTGNYATCCLVNNTFLKDNYCYHPVGFNASAPCPEISLGTNHHWNHLFLQSQNYWSEPVLPKLFQRLFAQPQPEVMLFDQGVFFEADLLGNLLLPDSVQYVIADFSTLFGKADGRMVMDWCISQQLPLVWGMGNPNTGVLTNQSLLAPVNQSFIDPTILSLNITSMPNVTIPASAIELFQQTWDLTNSSLIEDPALQNSTVYWYSTWAKLWSNLPELHTNQLKPGDCEDTKHCFAADDEGQCFCRYPSDD